MKTMAFVLTSATALILGLGPATAGPCATEIDNLTKTLAATDAGSGPTSGASAGTQPMTSSSGQHPPTAVMGQEAQGKATSPEDVRRQTQGQPTAAAEANTGRPAASAGASDSSAQHPPTAVMGQEAQGKATSPEDVRRQTQGQPTAAAEGNTGQSVASARAAEVNAALARAREFDQQGKEAECVSSIQQAKQLAGPK